MANLTVHKRARYVTRSELAQVPTPAGTSTFRPVPHIDLVEALSERLQQRGVTLARESLVVSANGMQVFGALDLEDGIEIPGLGRAVGFHAANDKSLAIEIVAGARVFVCDNLSLSGSAIVLKRKHTRSLSLKAEIDLALDRFEVGRRAFEASILALQERRIADDEAKVAIFDLTYAGIIGQSLFDEVSRGYFQAEKLDFGDCAPRTAWGLQNACTRAVKALSPASQHRTTAALGRFFSLGSQN